MYMTLSSKVKCLRYVNYFNIFDIPGLEIVRIDTKIISVWCLQPEIRKGHTQTCLTLIFKVNHQGQMTDFGFYEILDFENVRIDTKIKSAACIQPELRKVIQWTCVTLSSKVNRQGHVIFFNIFDILDLENVRIDTKIDFVSCLQPEIRKVTQKGVWPWFSRSCNKDRIFSLSPLDSLTPKTYPWEIFSKNSDGKAKIQGGVASTPPPPPLGVFGWRNTLGVCGLMLMALS